MEKIIDVQNLKTAFQLDEGLLYAVDNVSFHIEKGETVALVGESGCGKSVTSLSILRLIQSPPGKIVDGKILYKNKNLLELSTNDMRKIRGKCISMIFQEPMTSLNPVFTIGDQIEEALLLHTDCGRKQARQKAIEMLRLVGIPSAELRIDDYPHQLSGGMRQRVMIAMALSCGPDVLIADEPTTALDVTIQAQILDLLNKLQAELNMSILLITHDLAVVAEMAKRVIVMYAGKIAEEGSVQQIFKSPKHPYTVGLLNSIPKLGVKDVSKQSRLVTIKGLVPDLLNLPTGCRFQDRCPRVQDDCRKIEPPLEDKGNGQLAACFHPH